MWSSTKGRVWLWGDRTILYEGGTAVPATKALGVASDWDVTGIAESAAGDVFVVVKRGASGSAILWFDRTRTRLVEELTSDLSLSKIGGRNGEVWAVGEGGAALRFAPAELH